MGREEGHGAMHDALIMLEAAAATAAARVT
jgi:hypothetical protein